VEKSSNREIIRQVKFAAAGCVVNKPAGLNKSSRRGGWSSILLNTKNHGVKID
jgi:hypothetical protein